MIGIVREVFAKKKLVSDQVPVDYVSNFILVASAVGAAKKGLNLYHCASSSVNPLTWRATRDYMYEYFQKFPSEKKLVKTPYIEVYRNEHIFKVF